MSFGSKTNPLVGATVAQPFSFRQKSPGHGGFGGFARPSEPLPTFNSASRVPQGVLHDKTKLPSVEDGSPEEGKDVAKVEAVAPRTEHATEETVAPTQAMLPPTDKADMVRHVKELREEMMSMRFPYEEAVDGVKTELEPLIGCLDMADDKAGCMTLLRAELLRTIGLMRGRRMESCTEHDWTRKVSPDELEEGHDYDICPRCPWTAHIEGERLPWKDAALQLRTERWNEVTREWLE